MSLKTMIERHGLAPHPYEGWFRPVEGGVLQALGALDEAHWHRTPGAITYELAQGGPVALSLSPDGRRAEAARLMTPGERRAVPGETARAIACLGEAALLRLHMEADMDASRRYLLPDGWYPRP